MRATASPDLPAPPPATVASGAEAGGSIDTRVAYVAELFASLGSWVTHAHGVDWESTAGDRFRGAVEVIGVHLSSLGEVFAAVQSDVVLLRGTYDDVVALHTNISAVTSPGAVPEHWA